MSEIIKEALYLRLYHGRKHPNQSLDDWGAMGPLLGPFAWFHGTYLSNFTVGLDGGREPWHLRDSIVEDMIHYDGVYYGDFEIVPAPKNRDDGCTEFDRTKTKPRVYGTFLESAKAFYEAEEELYGDAGEFDEEACREDIRRMYGPEIEPQVAAWLKQKQREYK